ncbi:MAG: hypothetical protein ACJA09_003529 [Alcanivorax sp.]|jgi:hypothetical protein
MNIMSEKSSRLFVFIFFAFYLLVGLFIYPDYGMSSDEPTSRKNGLVNVKYIGENIAPFLLTDEITRSPDLYNWKDKDYGVAFEAPVVVLERLFNIKGSQNIYTFRHLMTFLFSFGGVVALYLTAKKVYGDYRVGLLAALMLILTPRMFAESFYNSKDIVFMASISMAIYSMTMFLSKCELKWAIAHGFFTALAVDIRIMGVVIFLCTLGAIGVRLFKNGVKPKSDIVVTLAYIVSSGFFVIAMFPYLWGDPVDHFIIVFKNMSHFRWNSSVLYMGDWVKAAELPWHYVPVWIAVTTPPLFLILMVVGSLKTIKQLLSNRFSLWSNDREMHDFLHLLLFFGPVLSVIVLSSVLYDGWRQLYFIYPAFILLSTKGFIVLSDAIRDRYRLAFMFKSTVVLCLFYNAYWIWNVHPLQNVYFNSFVGSDWRNKFELDYWGLGNREAIQYLLENDSGDVITLKADSRTPLRNTLLILERGERKRIKLVADEEDAEYLLTSYREVRESKDKKYDDHYNLFYQKIIDDEIILSVYKIKPRID